jgi:hypothetical protein
MTRPPLAGERPVQAGTFSPLLLDSGGKGSVDKNILTPCRA